MTKRPLISLRSQKAFVFLGLLLLLSVGSLGWAAQRNSAQTLQSLVRIKTMQFSTEMGYGVYVRNCSIQNPEIEKIISAHRQKDANFYGRLDALITKYRTRLVKELGEAEASRAIAAIDNEQRKAVTMLKEATAKDEQLHRFDCIKEPSSLPSVPQDIQTEIESLETQ